MKRAFSIVSFVIASAFFLGLAAGQMAIQPLDIKTGLWELTKTSSATYPMPKGLPPEVAKMLTPAQRAQYQEALKKSAEASAQGTQTKSTVCLRQSDLDVGNMLGPGQTVQDCTDRSVTSTKQLFAVTCPAISGAQNLETFRFERIDAEHFKGEIHLAEGDNASKVGQTITARWIGASCGNEPIPRSAEPELVTVSVIRPLDDYFAVVVNHASSPMTAYSAFVYMYLNGDVHRHVYDGSAEGHKTVKPGGSVQDRLEGIVRKAKVAAALFADGTTFGSPKEVAVLKALLEQEHARIAEKMASGPKDLSFLLPSQPMVPAHEGYYVGNSTPTDHWPPGNAPLLHLCVKGDELTVMRVLGHGGPTPLERLWVQGLYTSNPFRAEMTFHNPDFTKPIETAIHPDALYIGNAWWRRLSDAATASPPH